jgi:hypothetical protein
MKRYQAVKDLVLSVNFSHLWPTQTSYDNYSLSLQANLPYFDSFPKIWSLAKIADFD